MLANTIVDVRAAKRIVAFTNSAHSAGAGQVGTGQIGRAANHAGHCAVYNFQSHLAGFTRCDFRFVFNQLGTVCGHCLRKGGAVAAVKCSTKISTFGACCQTVAPGRTCRGTTRRCLLPVRIDCVRDFKSAVIPSQFLARGGNFIVSKGCTVNTGRALLVGRTIANYCFTGDHRRAGVRSGSGNRRLNRVRVMSVNRLNMPASSGKPRGLIGGGGKVGATVNGDCVIVPHHNKPAKAKMSGQINCLVADAFHQASISGNHISPVIHQIIAKAGVLHPFSQRHTHSI